MIHENMRSLIGPPISDQEQDTLAQDIWHSKDRGYYNRKGEPISMMEFSGLLMSDEYKIIKQEQVSEFFVSTVWLGMDYNAFRRMTIPGGHAIHIFETMIFSNREDFDDMYQERYSTEQEALEGHKVAVEWAKKHITIEGQ